MGWACGISVRGLGVEYTRTADSKGGGVDERMVWISE